MGKLESRRVSLPPPLFSPTNLNLILSLPLLLSLSYFPDDIPAVVIEPLGQRGWLLVAGWSVRCFSRSDELWITGLAEKLRTALEAHWGPEAV